MQDQSIDPPWLEHLLDALAERTARRVVASLEQSREATRALRTAEAAKLLALSPTETRRHLKSGRLRSVRVGRIRLIPMSAIDEFLRDR
jgi:excisionase family DNA binding protein